MALSDLLSQRKKALEDAYNEYEPQPTEEEKKKKEEERKAALKKQLEEGK